MPSDYLDDIDKHLKSIGATPFSEKGKAAPAPVPEKSAGRSMLSKAMEDQFGYMEDVTKGLVRGGTRAMSGAARMIGKELPTGMQQFADAPAESPGESFGTTVGEYGAPMLTGAGLGGLAARALAGPAARGVAALNALRGRNMIAATPMAAGARVAQGAGGLAGSGAAGALADPDNPGQGAIAGTVGGAVPGAVGGAMRSNIGRETAGHLARGGVAWAAYNGLQAVGLPGEPAWIIAIPNIKWLKSPTGRRLNWLGDKIMDGAGNVIAQVPPSAAGTLAAELSKRIGTQ